MSHIWWLFLQPVVCPAKWRLPNTHSLGEGQSFRGVAVHECKAEDVQYALGNDPLMWAQQHEGSYFISTCFAGRRFILLNLYFHVSDDSESDTQKTSAIHYATVDNRDTLFLTAMAVTTWVSTSTSFAWCLLLTKEQGSKTIALFTFEIITCLVLLASLYLTARFKWTRNERKDTVRTVGCVVATITAIWYEKGLELSSRS
jgi:hypothetical protein